ncbi:MAG: hypothetical protein WCY08_10140, partial [Rhodocyclaceae bacterium]
DQGADQVRLHPATRLIPGHLRSDDLLRSGLRSFRSRALSRYIPNQAHIVQLMQKAAERIPPERLWVNPDCGLKTRQWAEVIPALRNMVAAARTLREAT